MKKSLLVTGASGYIGSHTTLELLQECQQYDIILLDNLCNSSHESIRRIQEISGRRANFIQGDVRNRSLLNNIFSDNKVELVLHFAGLKSVNESIQDPLSYYDNNLCGTISLCSAMKEAGVFNLIFSSSATVYGEPNQIPVTENCPVGEPSNPYGKSKLMAEYMLRDLCISDPRWSIGLLRYFNPVGAHSSGMIGEDPKGTPNNLLPYICQVAVGKLDGLSIFGNDYPTHDGTGVRDFIHVVDLAKGHVAAAKYVLQNKGCYIWNLGTGVGYSVLDILAAFEKETHRKIPYKFAPRRLGDIAECWSSPDKAHVELKWSAMHDLSDMVRDAWRWQELNPNGYT